MTELVTFGESSVRLSTEGCERFETATDVSLQVSGTASNVAVAASALGAEAAWLSKLPDTMLGHRVERALHEHDVRTEVAWADAGRQGLVFVESGAEPRQQRRLEDREGSAAATVQPGELPMDRVQAADATFIAGSTLALSGNVVETAQAVMRAASGGPVAMDLDYRPEQWAPGEARETLEGVFDAIDVLIANEGQVTSLLDRTGEPRKLAHTIANEYDFEVVVITRSQRGALAWHDSVIHERGGIAVEAVDPAGQHDAFTGALLERLIAGATVDEALTYGVASATLTRTIPGPMTTITREEVDALVDERD
jgi:2-dehydro-3-deoxygluconokinase